MFSKLKYPANFVNSIIARFIISKASDMRFFHDNNNSKENPTRISLPSKDQKSSDAVRWQLTDLGNKIGKEIQPVFTSRKIQHEVKLHAPKPAIINQQSVVYSYKCDLCDADHVGYTRRHLHQRVKEHKRSAIGKHLEQKHNQVANTLDLKHFSILKKCQSAKLFTYNNAFLIFLYF